MIRGFSYILFLALINQVRALLVRQLYQFPNTTFTDIENVAFRSNGDLLLSLITEPATYLFHPGSGSQPTRLAEYPDGLSTLGIAQPSPDLFAVVVGNYSVTTFAGIPGSFAVWTIDLTSTEAVVTKIADIPEAHALNGMTTNPRSPDTVLLADSNLGAVISLNIRSGVSQVVLQSSYFTPTASMAIGLNGIHVSGSTLHFTNSAQGVYGRVPITANGSQAGAVSIIARSPPGLTYDDFALDSQGNAWIASHPNAISKVTPGGQQTIAVGGGSSTELSQPSSLIAGSGKLSGTIYAVTGGEASSAGAISGQVFSLTNL